MSIAAEFSVGVFFFLSEKELHDYEILINKHTRKSRVDLCMESRLFDFSSDKLEAIDQLDSLIAPLIDWLIRSLWLVDRFIVRLIHWLIDWLIDWDEKGLAA